METSRAPVRADLFDPASLASLGHVEIIARWVVDGFLTGLHRSPKKGFSVEFAEYRGYQPGDDLRFIDWKIAAPGPHQLMARATDDAGRTQPPGRTSERVDTYEQNGYQTVHVMVT